MTASSFIRENLLLGLATLLGALSALGCQRLQPAASPESGSGSGGDKQSTEETAFKDDAMKAMVELAGQWTLVGMGDGKGEAPASWHHHGASGTCMPRGSASWVLQKEVTFAPTDEAVSLWNENLKTLVTLYTYPAAQALDAEFKRVMGDVTGTCSEGPVMSTESGGAHVMGCVSRLQEGPLLLEQATLVQREQWFYKARITFPQALLAQAYPAAMAVAAQGFKPCPAE